jgi:hypothetical protein
MLLFCFSMGDFQPFNVKLGKNLISCNKFVMLVRDGRWHYVNRGIYFYLYLSSLRKHEVDTYIRTDYFDQILMNVLTGCTIPYPYN